MPLNSAGIWEYEEGESVSPFSVMLNRLSNSITDSLGHAHGDTGWINDGIAYNTNWSDWGGTNPVLYRIKGGVLHWNGLVRRDAGLSGGAAAFTMLTVPAGARPDFQRIAACMSSLTGATGAASTGTAHTHPLVDSATMGPMVRVTVATNGNIGITTAAGWPMAAGNWVNLADIPPYPVVPA